MNRDYLSRGCHVNIRDHRKWTPLHCAAMLGNIEIANILLDAEADVNAVDSNGLAPVDIALEYGNYTGEIRYVSLKILLMKNVC